MITLEQPQGLLVLPLAIVIASAIEFIRRIRGRKRFVPGRGERLFHWLALALLAFGLASPSWVQAPERPAVALLWDRSPSVTGERKDAAWTTPERQDFEKLESLLAVLPADVPAALFDFAGAPRLLRPYRAGSLSTEERRAIENAPPPGGLETDITRAALFAAALAPAGRRVEILLLSDGWATASEAHPRLATRRAGRISTIPCAGIDAPEVLARELSAPNRLFENEPTSLRLRVWASRRMTVAAQLYANDLLAASREADLLPGENEVVFEGVQSPPGFARWNAILLPKPGQDTWAANNRASTLTRTRSAARVLLLDPDPESVRSFAAVLRVAGFDPVVGDAARLPRSAADLAGFDAVILSDFPAAPLEGDSTAAFSEWVAGAGGALIVCGGTGAFSPGGYAGSQFEELLPVRSARPDELQQAVVAVLVILDRSGSMQVPVGGRPKMELAAKGAAMAMDVLGQNDYFGVHAVDTRVHEILPLSAKFDRSAARSKILGITSSGGGIYIYTALLEAGRQIEAVEAKVKHIILFADAADAEEKTAGSESDGTAGGGSALDLAIGLLSRGVTISVLALGNAEDRDTAFLTELAERGGGKFYLTGNALDLPQIFTTETSRIARQDFTEDPFLAVPVSDGSQVTRGIDWATAPFLFGANLVEPRAGTTIELLTEEGTPLLAHRRAGLGRVAVFASDVKGRWAFEWLAWEGFQTLWSRLLRHLLPGETPGTFELQIVEGRTQGRLIEMSAISPSGWFLNGLSARFIMQSDERGVTEISAQQTAPGTYAAPLPDFAGGSAALVTAVLEQSARPLGTLALPGGATGELQRLGVSETRLREIAARTGGRFFDTTEAASAWLRDATIETGRPQTAMRFALAPLAFGLGLIAMFLKLVSRRLRK